MMSCCSFLLAAVVCSNAACAISHRLTQSYTARAVGLDPFRVLLQLAEARELRSEAEGFGDEELLAEAIQAEQRLEVFNSTAQCLWHFCLLPSALQLHAVSCASPADACVL